MKKILNNAFLNKSTAFSKKERKENNLTGLLPTKIETLEEQSARAYKVYSRLENDYDKHLHLMDIYSDNLNLFYYLVGQHIEEMLPIIYTPTIADGVKRFSEDFKDGRGAAFISVDEPENIRESLKNASANLEDVKLLVITDGEGVLGIGDWGIQGGWIAVGKLAVYTAASGINPKNVLPVIIDAGTNNEELLNDPLYLGTQHRRLEQESYLEFIDDFVNEALELFPNVLFHWEDFGRENAATILDKYRDKLTTFNDDIQGTGIMMAAAVESVVTITQKSLEKHKVLIFGAGTAGIGIADQLVLELELKGINKEEAKENIYLFDKDGLILNDSSNLTEGQKRYAHNNNGFDGPTTNLEDAVEIIKPSILIGTSGQPGAFTEKIVKKMSEYNERPAILPISNPTELCEALASDIIKWTNGKGLVVTGSPSDPVEYNGMKFTIGQANNALLYPGLGFGAVAAKAKKVTPNMLSAAASGIVSLQNLDELGAGLLPPVSNLREASKLVAISVVEAAVKDGVNREQINDAEEVVEEAIWYPR